jgi:hypothetical protein
MPPQNGDHGLYPRESPSQGGLRRPHGRRIHRIRVDVS